MFFDHALSAAVVN